MVCGILHLPLGCRGGSDHRCDGLLQILSEHHVRVGGERGFGSLVVGCCTMVLALLHVNLGGGALVRVEFLARGWGRARLLWFGCEVDELIV